MAKILKIVLKYNLIFALHSQLQTISHLKLNLVFRFFKFEAKYSKHRTSVFFHKNIKIKTNHLNVNSNKLKPTRNTGANKQQIAIANCLCYLLLKKMLTFTLILHYTISMPLC